jgi:hypothetical protein
LPKGGKSQYYGGKYPQIDEPFSKINKRPDTEEISILIEEIRPKLTTVMLNSKSTCSDRAKKPDPSNSSGLYVKIRQ